MNPVLHHCTVNGTNLAYFEWGRAITGKPTLLFVHATGFHGRVWDQIIRALPDIHAIALEQRGHGRSDKVAVSHWRTFGKDQAEFIQALQLSNLIGIGHSMGAHAMIDAAFLTGAFDRLLLLDPTVAAPEAYDAAPPDANGELHPAAKRRNRFDSVDDMIARIAHKSAFPRFDPKILRDYCQHGLEPAPLPDGGLTLCCTPEVEAHVYMSSLTNGGVYASARSLDIPVTIVRARRAANDWERDFSSSPTWPELAQEFPRGRDIHFADCSHFIPMERPDRVVELIRHEIARSMSNAGDVR